MWVFASEADSSSITSIISHSLHEPISSSWKVTNTISIKISSPCGAPRITAIAAGMWPVSWFSMDRGKQDLCRRLRSFRRLIMKGIGDLLIEYNEASIFSSFEDRAWRPAANDVLVSFFLPAVCFFCGKDFGIACSLLFHVLIGCCRCSLHRSCCLSLGGMYNRYLVRGVGAIRRRRVNEQFLAINRLDRGRLHTRKAPASCKLELISQNLTCICPCYWGAGLALAGGI